ncbi:MAG: aminotransferase class V-fold PLP-dependent enzyme [Candidatus Coatesbacteria bacterium]|nr:aminotransferase class V-fold PLP-dependent enzyme [Candidatus Coatesbacteria bacterium]
MIYVDNAATSFPKPGEVGRAMLDYLENKSANPGRSAHRLSIEAGRAIYRTRENLARLLDLKDPLRIVFCLNATEALNLVIRGFLEPGMHVITSSMEHNSVMRPLRNLEKKGVEITVIRDKEDELFINDLEKSIKKNTALILLNHASNVNGRIFPIKSAGKIAEKNGILFMIDAAQSAGCIPIDMYEDNINILAFTGHKSLYGPQGTGGLAIRDDVDFTRIKTLKTGGTGSKSEKEEQPTFLPDMFESGTPNGVGLSGLNAGIEFITARKINEIHDFEISLAHELKSYLKKSAGITIYEPLSEDSTATVSFNIDRLPSSKVAMILDEKYEIMTRAGLHCAPSAHKSIGSFPSGTVRISFGIFNTYEHVEKLIDAIIEISRDF